MNIPNRQQPATHGIVTLADHHYFPGLETLYLSVQESFPTPIACFDIGLSEAQKEAAARNYPRLSILPVPENADVTAVKKAFGDAPALQKLGKRVWPLWLCPFLIAASPFRRVFWMDTDIVVLRRLRELFAMLDAGPVFTPENLAPELTANKPELYGLLPIDRPFDPRQPTANGGVSGWDLERDREALEAYMHPIRRACRDSAVRDAIAWHDQGALIWAIQKTGLEHRVVESWDWNLCVRHTPAFEKRYAWGKDVLETLRRDVPAANLLHWNGVPVPWSNS
jgi:hypothetical protein